MVDPQTPDDAIPQDTRYRVETPEQLGLHYDVAGLGTRLMAAIVDMIFLGLLGGATLCLGLIGVSAVVSSFGDEEMASAIALAIIGLVFFALVWGYYVLFETVWHGQSPGKRWTGLRVIQDGGYPIGFSQAAIRNIVRIADFLPFAYIVGSLVMLFDSRSRRLGDLVAGTIVIKEQQAVSLGSIAAMTSPLVEGIQVPRANPGSWPSPTSQTELSQFPNLSRITSAEYSLLREFLQRRETLAIEARNSLALQLARGFALRLDYTPAGDHPEQFLQRVAIELAARHGGGPPVSPQV